MCRSVYERTQGLPVSQGGISGRCVYINTYIYICIYMYICIYVYVDTHTYRERERERHYSHLGFSPVHIKLYGLYLVIRRDYR